MGQGVVSQQARCGVQRPQPLDDPHQGGDREMQIGRLLRIDRTRLNHQQACARGEAPLLHVACERDEPTGGAFDLGLGHEGSQARPTAQQASAFQLPQGAAESEAVDTQHVTQFTFGGNSIAGGQLAALHATQEGIRYLSVERGTGDQPVYRTLEMERMYPFAGYRSHPSPWCTYGLLVYTSRSLAPVATKVNRASRERPGAR